MPFFSDPNMTSNPANSNANVSASASPNSVRQLTQSWAHSVSDYLLQRRAQTQHAYQNAFGVQAGLAKPVAHGDEQGREVVGEDALNTDWLFKALFIALAQQLEEGHTVLTLTAESIEDDRQMKESADDPLYPWQRQLLSILLSPLSGYIDKVNIPVSSSAISAITLSTPHNNKDAGETSNVSDDVDKVESDTDTGTNTDINSLSNQPLNHLLATWPQVAMQLALPRDVSQILSDRHHLGQRLYDYFIQNNQPLLSTDLGSENSLSNFIELIHQNDLLSPISTSRSDPQLQRSGQASAPIRFKAYQIQNSLSITLWLQSTWQAEYALAKQIQIISTYKVTPLALSTNEQLNIEQQAAIDIANHNAFSIITGGPGTGKTYTVAQLVIALKGAATSGQPEQRKQHGSGQSMTSLALAAPTGKAAQRMQESLQAALDAAGVSMQLQEAKTIHRLLGIGQGGRPRYHADNPLSEDIVIVDEASMLGVELANHLVSAIKPGARLILLGDAHQLAAVDAGAVLADLCRIPMLQSMHQQLIASRRFSEDSGIGQLAKQINAADIDMQAVWRTISNDDALAFYPVNQRSDIDPLTINQEDSFDDLNQLDSSFINSLSNSELLKQLTQNYTPFIKQIKQLLPTSSAKSIPSAINDFADPLSSTIDTSAPDQNITELMTTLNQFRILTAGHHGRWGDQALNEYISQWHIGELKLPISNSPWYHGRPVMVLQNSYEMGLFNGDIGICLQTSRGLEVFFENKPQGIAVNLLSDEMIATAYAMTIHKSQGSEFDHVAITFDDSNSRLLSKELIYTAVTRAKRQVSIYSSKSALTRAIKTPTLRQTGLALQFEEGRHDISDAMKG